MIRVLNQTVRTLRSVEKGVKRRATDNERPRGIYFGRRVLLRIAEALSQNEHEAALIRSHVLRKRRGFGTARCGEAEPPRPAVLADPSVVTAASGHMEAGIQSRVAWRAAMLVAEARVVLRINDANARGSSPKVVELVKWLFEDWPVAERRGRYPALVTKMGRMSIRTDWARRFRKRWHIRLRVMPWRSAVAPEMQSRKVFWGESGAIFDVVFWPHFWGRKTAPKMGTGINRTTWGPHFWGRNLAPFLGPFFQENSDLRSPPRAPQVAAFFQWCQWLRMAVVGEEPCIVVNVDETAISRGMTPRRGHCVGRLAAAGRQRYARITLREARGHMTYVAAIADDPDVHRRLPQILLPHTERLTRADRERLAALEAPLLQIAGTKGWVTADVFCDILTRIRRVCREVHPGRPVIVVMDCAPQHLSWQVLNHIARLGLFVALVPSSMTWLLQPLDTHVFQHLKAGISSGQTTCRGESADGVLPPGRWVDIAAAAMREHVVDTNSAGHMWANGLRGPGPTLRARISDALGTTLPLPLRPPTAQDFADLLGRPAPRMLQSLLGPPRRFLARKLARAAAVAGGPAPVARRLGPPLRRAGSAPVAASSADASGGAMAGVAEPTAPRRTRSGVMY